MLIEIEQKKYASREKFRLVKIRTSSLPARLAYQDITSLPGRLDDHDIPLTRISRLPMCLAYHNTLLTRTLRLPWLFIKYV